MSIIPSIETIANPFWFTKVIITCYNQTMKKITQFILKQYAKMSGEKKIRLAMDLSQMVREVRKMGHAQTGA